MSTAVGWDQWGGGRGGKKRGGERKKESESCIAVELNVGALKYYMLIAINVDMMWACKYGHTDKFSHYSQQMTENKAILTGFRPASC